jgi:5-(carboxyamino)imidazole ribonucleotide mutase
LALILKSKFLRGIVFGFNHYAIVKETGKTKLNPVVGIIMGSESDWETMAEASKILHQFSVLHECKVVSAHRTPDWLARYAKTARSRGLQVIIAGAGGAAHLPGMCAAWTDLPVLGVPVESRALCGVDSLLSIVQMPRGIPVGTLAIGVAGAVNAALLAVQILSLHNDDLHRRLQEFRRKQTQSVLRLSLPVAELRSVSQDKKS